MLKETGIKLVFRDVVTSSSYDMMRDQLVDAFTSADRIELVFKEIWSVDKTLVDLMCGAHRVADSLGKTLTISFPDSAGAIEELVDRYCYTDTPCENRNSDCLYRHGSAGAVRLKKC